MTAPPDDWEERDAERRRRAERAVRGVFAATLCLEALTVVLVPRAVAPTDGLGTTRLVLLLGLAALMVVTSGMLRRRWGLAVGSVLQLALLACGLITTAMFALGAVFGLIWVYELRLRNELLTPAPPPVES